MFTYSDNIQKFPQVHGAVKEIVDERESLTFTNQSCISERMKMNVYSVFIRWPDGSLTPLHPLDGRKSRSRLPQEHLAWLGAFGTWLRVFCIKTREGPFSFFDLHPAPREHTQRS